MFLSFRIISMVFSILSIFLLVFHSCLLVDLHSTQKFFGFYLPCELFGYSRSLVSHWNSQLILLLWLVLAGLNTLKEVEAPYCSKLRIANWEWLYLFAFRQHRRFRRPGRFLDHSFSENCVWSRSPVFLHTLSFGMFIRHFLAAEALHICLAKLLGGNGEGLSRARSFSSSGLLRGSQSSLCHRLWPLSLKSSPFH